MANAIKVGDEECEFGDVAKLLLDSSVATKIIELWPELAGQLKTDPLEVMKWKQNKLLGLISNSELIVYLLTEWRARAASAATLQNLCTAFKNIKILEAEGILVTHFVTSRGNIPNADNNSNSAATITESPNTSQNDAYPRHNPSDTHYAMIINLIKYKKKPPRFENKDRTVGAPLDSQRMKATLEQFGYEVDVYDDPSELYDLDYLKHFISEFRNKCSQSQTKPSSVVIFFGGHGTNEKLVLGDLTTVNLYQKVVYQFNTERAPNLVQVPKIFIFNTCQVFATPETPILDGNAAETPPPPPMDNAIICFSTMPGYGANRFSDGSVYVNLLTQELLGKDSNKDFEAILKKVEDDTWKAIDPVCREMLKEGNPGADVEVYKQRPTHRPMVHFKKYFFT